MTSELSGKVALVTGGASGIGRASVITLADAGAAVAVLDREETGANAVVTQVKQSGGKALAVVTDLSDTSRIPDTVAHVLQEFGRIDFLINCAGVAGKFQPLLEIDDQNWDFVHTVNLKAPMLLMKHVARHMIDRGGGGRIVNVSSSSAFRARNSPIAYATSKAAIVQLTRSAAAELGRYDINVNAIAPGITATGMTQGFGDAAALERIASSGPLENLFHRVSQPEDVAAAVLFLCIPASRQITGQTIHTSAGAVV
ncbi:MAG: SDR family oxidoreductase [Candidatus Binatus sp.]|uniref:SDR family NAD(P)-dependent oxidoreductase n=1 Tax=Candidatus Binatus sp. TaxID=2811406 RepID=UPI0027258322|nr:SDR family oxidoreductase [Candidatus Binatus sp.]MDO8432095.1 SDR family oxidoreductase [Candidatus Binatus sp.]